MSPTNIALLILAGVGIMAAAAYFIQMYENRKKEQQLRLMHLQAVIRRAHHLLANYPPLLQNPEIIKFLTLYLSQRCKAALELEASENLEKILTETQDRSESPMEAPAHPEGSLTLFRTPNEAQRARAIIKEFVKFLKEIEAKGEISSAASSTMIQHAKHGFERTEIDLELQEATVTEEINDGKRSFNTYKKCFIHLSDLNKNHILDRQLFELRNRMNRLAEHIERKTAEEKERRRKEEEEANKFGSR